MGTVKSAIFTACIMGVISSVFDIASPDGSMKKQLSVLVGIITVLGIISVFTDNGFEISFQNYHADTQYIQEIYERNLSSKITEQVLENAKLQYEEYFANKLNSNGITAYANVRLSINAQNEIEVTAVEIVGISYDSFAESLIYEDLPDTQVSFSEEAENID